MGHHIGSALIAAGHDVVGVDNMCSGVQLARGSYASEVVGNFADLTFRGGPTDALVHCAAYADVSRNWDSQFERDKIWMNNVARTRMLFENARAAGVERIVFISTMAVLADEISPYAASKIAGEALTRCYAPNAQILRLSSVVGEGYHHGHIADFVRSAKQDGAVFSKTSGLTKRGFVHALDVADAVVRALTLPASETRALSGGPWCPRDTVRIMACPSVWAQEEFGWKGDVAVDGPRNCFRSLEDGVRDALRSLGWTGALAPRASAIG